MSKALPASHATGNCGKMMTHSYVSSQPSQELGPDNNQTGGPVPVLPAYRPTAGDFPGEFMCVFSFV